MARPRRGAASVPKKVIEEQHLTWLQALPGDGPFLTVPVLTEVFDHGLELAEPARAAAFKAAYNTYRLAPAVDKDTDRDAFIRTTVRDVLDWHNHVDTSTTTSERYAYETPAFGVTTTPAFALWPCEADDVEEDTTPCLLGFVWPDGTVLNRRMLDGWAATPIDRAAATLRHHNIPLGVVTNGRTWVIVWAPRGTATGWVLFDTHAMLDDRQLLDAFTTLLSRRRFCAVAADETLDALLNRALASQEDLTENLSVQVRKAVEMLVDAIGRADKDSGGAALAGLDADDIYEGAVTVVMRLVFMLAAEERRLLPGDDAFYAANYAIAGLADRLIAQATVDGEDVLARQAEGFPQVLAATRVVHDGVRHQTLNIKGYGGSVFDPQRFPWLEGAQAGGTGQPAHVDDRTMLHILTGLTRWQGRRLAYRTLDVEQIGYVYEGLLDHTAVKADTPYLGLRGAKEPEVTIDEVEAQAARGDTALTKWLKDATGLTPAQVKKALAVGPPDTEQARLLLASCGGDQALADRITPYLNLVRADERTGQPIVFLPGEWFVTASTARSDAGSYYTPRSLAEEVVKHTLDALVYTPGPLETLEEAEWRIVAPDTILDLSVADIAMGSGAFLVAADRYLADRLIESVTTHTDTTYTDPALVELARIIEAAAGADPDQRDSDADEATVAARRLVASRCLYGADINPMAVEMAKLSLWLATAAKDQPFGFLDHRLAVGDSLLGLTDVRQLEYVHPDPDVGVKIHASSLYDQTAHIRSALEQAIGKRRAIEAMRVHDLRDIEQQQALLADANRELADLSLLADAITAESFAAAQDKNKSLDSRMLTLGTDGGLLLADSTPDDEKARIRDDFRAAVTRMQAGAPAGGFERNPVQWAVRFPEVFLDSGEAGFDAVIGNPPFLGGQKITGAMGTDYRNYLVLDLARGKPGSADLVVYFLLLACRVSAERVGVLTTNTISQGESRTVGLGQLEQTRWVIQRAVRSKTWPSKSASLSYASVFLVLGDPRIRVLDELPVRGINPELRSQSRVSGEPLRLVENRSVAFQGMILLGTGFRMTPEAAKDMIDQDPRNAEVLFPYLGGNDVNSSPTARASEWTVNFFDWPQQKAQQYALPFAHLMANVQPERALKDAVKYPKMVNEWWKYWNERTELSAQLTELDSVLVLVLHSNTVQPIRVTSKQVFSNALCVFATEAIEDEGLLCSSVHGEWARKYAGSIQAAVRYGPSEVFETLPRVALGDAVRAASTHFIEARKRVFQGRKIGLTLAYKMMNTPDEMSDDIVGLREQAQLLDDAVLAAYGWSDLDVTRDFRETEHGRRFAMAPEVVVEMLDRLLELNHERYADEVARGLHGKQANQGRRKAKGVESVGGGDVATLFD